MQLDILKTQTEAAAQASGRGKVVVSLNPVKTKIRIDIDGNEIDPRTRQIIRLEKDVK